MKLLIFSDVHRNKSLLESVLKERSQDVDLCISLGDTELKVGFLEKHDIVAIKGNYPFDPGLTYEHEMIVEGKRILLTHGHKYDVRNGVDTLHSRMLKTEVDIAFYGHTHTAAFYQVGHRLIANPGALNRTGDGEVESYLIVEVFKDKIHFHWYNAFTHDVIEEIIKEI